MPIEFNPVNFIQFSEFKLKDKSGGKSDVNIILDPWITVDLKAVCLNVNQ